MGRTSWCIMWGIVVLAALAGLKALMSPSPELGHRGALEVAYPSSFLGALIWLAVLFPLFAIGAWLRRRVVDQRTGRLDRPDWVPLRRGVAYVVLVPLAAAAAWAAVFAATPASDAGATRQTAAAELTVDDKLELERILTSVMQDPDTLGEMKPRFWEWADSHGGLSEQGLDEMREGISTGLQVSRLFWEESLITLQRGKPFKSTEREQLENQLVAQGKMSDFQRRENEANMERISAGQPIAIAGGEKVVVTEELARTVLTDFDRKEQAATVLLTRPAN